MGLNTIINVYTTIAVQESASLRRHPLSSSWGRTPEVHRVKLRGNSLHVVSATTLMHKIAPALTHTLIYTCTVRGVILFRSLNPKRHRESGALDFANFCLRLRRWPSACSSWFVFRQVYHARKARAGLRGAQWFAPTWDAHRAVYGPATKKPSRFADPNEITRPRRLHTQPLRTPRETFAHDTLRAPRPASAPTRMSGLQINRGAPQAVSPVRARSLSRVPGRTVPMS